MLGLRFYPNGRAVLGSDRLRHGHNSEDNVVFSLAEIGVICFTPEPITLSLGSLIAFDWGHVLQPPTNHWISQIKIPSEGDRLDPFHQNLSYAWKRVGGCWVGKPQNPHTCRLFCCPASSDLVLVRQIKVCCLCGDPNSFDFQLPSQFLGRSPPSAALSSGSSALGNGSCWPEPALAPSSRPCIWQLFLGSLLVD